jgi:hypothetical protein
MTFDYKSLVTKVSGDLVVLGLKDTCKTTLLMHLARTLRENPQNHVIIFETFPKWIHEFDSIPYMVIADSDVQTKEDTAFLENGSAYIQWSRDYHILNSKQIVKALKENKDLVFLIECEDMEKISAFMTFVIYTIYRKQYLRAKAECLEKVNEHYWFLVEESHNLLDSTVIAKKTFNKLRKIQNEFRNLKMHMVCVALRLQDLSPKIRTKMQILLAKISLDDFQLKVRNLLRNSKYKDKITTLPKGSFILPETDTILKTTPFQQNGKPFEIKPQINNLPSYATKLGEHKPNIIERIQNYLKPLFQPSHRTSENEPSVYDESEDAYTEVEEDNLAFGDN